MELLVIGWLLLSVGVGYLASERGRSWVAWSLLSVVTSPLLGVIIVLLSRNLFEEAATVAREEARHREQLAAISRAQPQGMSRSSSEDTRRPVRDAQDESPSSSTVLIADELEKLAALRDKAVLTASEFEEQKARLLGKSAPSATTNSLPTARAPESTSGLSAIERIARGE